MPKFLAWVQARRTRESAAAHAAMVATVKKKKGAAAADALGSDDRFPSGKECYHCFNIRRNFYGSIPQEELIAKRAADPTVDDEANAYREDEVSGEKKSSRRTSPRCARWKKVTNNLSATSSLAHSRRSAASLSCGRSSVRRRMSSSS